MMNIVLLSLHLFSLLHVTHGSINGDLVTISGAIWEFYEGDCPGQDIAAFAVKIVGESGWENDREFCANECLSRSNCVAFNYPNPGNNGQCWLKYNPNRQESQTLGVSCDNNNPSSPDHYYTFIRMVTTTTTTAEPTTAAPTTAEPTTAAPTHACDGVVCPDGLICEGGECQRDCEMFQIDEYLLDCSDEFDSNTNDIDALQTSVGVINSRIDNANDRIDINEVNISSIFDELDNMNQNILLNDINIGAIFTRLNIVETNITSLAEDIDSQASNIESISNQISEIQTDIETINNQLIAYRANAVQSFSSIPDNDIKKEPLLSPNTKDLLIIGSLLVNTIIICSIMIYCSCKNVRHQEYSKVSYTTDDELQQLGK